MIAYGATSFTQPWVVVMMGLGLSALSSTWPLVGGGSVQRRILVMGVTIAILIGAAGIIMLLRGHSQWIALGPCVLMCVLAVGIARVSLTRRTVIYRPQSRMGVGIDGSVSMQG